MIEYENDNYPVTIERKSKFNKHNMIVCSGMLMCNIMAIIMRMMMHTYSRDYGLMEWYQRRSIASEGKDQIMSYHLNMIWSKTFNSLYSYWIQFWILNIDIIMSIAATLYKVLTGLILHIDLPGVENVNLKLLKIPTCDKYLAKLAIGYQK